MPTPHAVGIDLGTTYSAVAAIDASGRTTIVRNEAGELLTPSVVLFDRDEVIVGREAKKARGADSQRLAECVKREMGNRFYSRAINGEKLRPEVIQACILRKLRENIEQSLGKNFKTVITVPAYFDEPRRTATLDAGEMAGLDVLDIVNEPTAAALAYGEQLGYLGRSGMPESEMNVLVYDLGGGTFDVTVIELGPGKVRTLATDGDAHLGGYDWDRRLVDFVSRQFQEQYGADPRGNHDALSHLLTEVEEAKHTLTLRGHARIHVRCGDNSLDVPVTRAQFEEMTADLLERTAFTTREVLASAGREWSDLSRVLLVGGSTRMPMVEGMLRKNSGAEPQRAVNPDEAVARGAAIYARHLLQQEAAASLSGELAVTMVNAHSLGIEGVDVTTQQKENITLIPKNTPLPARAARQFVTKTENQPTIVIRVLEGESRLPERCTPIGRAVIRDMPQGLPKGWPVAVDYEYGANGRLSVRGRVQGASGDAAIVLQRDGGLTPTSKGRWRRVVERMPGFDVIEDALAEVLSLESVELVDESNVRKTTERPGRVPMPAAKVEESADSESAKSQAAGLKRPAPRPKPARPVPLPGIESSASEMRLADASSEDTAEYPPWRRFMPQVIEIGGHVMFAVVGLLVGYYLLCWMMPEANFLGLDLPGLASPEAK